MTFEKFESIVKKYRPDIFEVSKHGDYDNGTSNYTLGICFKEGGKVYHYSGSYKAILEKLNCPIVLKKEVEAIKKHIESANQYINEIINDIDRFGFNPTFESAEEKAKYIKTLEYDRNCEIKKLNDIINNNEIIEG